MSNGYSSNSAIRNVLYYDDGRVMKVPFLSKAAKGPGRNDPCPCNSKLKFKKCHGDEELRVQCETVGRQAMRNAMLQMVAQRQMAGGICPRCQGKFNVKTRICKDCDLEIISQEEAEKRQNSKIVVPEKKLILPN